MVMNNVIEIPGLTFVDYYKIRINIMKQLSHHCPSWKDLNT